MAAMYLLDPNPSAVALVGVLVIGSGVFGLVCRGFALLAGEAWRARRDERESLHRQDWHSAHMGRR